MSQISVVIITYNEAENIGPCLDSLLQQSRIDDVREILVVDNGSEDTTISTALARRPRVHGDKIRVLQAPRNNLGASRALAVQIAQAPLIAFIDADCLAPQDWLERLQGHLSRAKLKNPATVGVGGPNRLPESHVFGRSANLLLSSFLGHGFSAQAWQPPTPRAVNHLATTNCLLERDAIVRVGSFSAEFARAGEDLDLGRRLTEHGAVLMLYPEPVMINKCAEGWRSWGERLYRFGLAQWETLATSSWTSHKVDRLKVGLAWTLLLILVLTAISPIARGLVLLYLFINLNTAAFAALRRDQGDLTPFVFFGFLVTHFAYAMGLIVGSTRACVLQLKKVRALAWRYLHSH